MTIRLTIPIAESIKKREIRDKLYLTKEWKELRKKVLERDNHQCQICLKHKTELKDGILCIHHIIRRKHNGSESTNNLTSVCIRCHHIIEIGKPLYIKDNREKIFRSLRDPYWNYIMKEKNKK